MDYPASIRLQGLYREHRDWLRRVIFRRTGCPEKAADLTQDVFLRLLSRDATPHLKEPRAYLARIAHGLMVDDWRRRDLEQAWRESVEGLSEQEAPSPEDRVSVMDGLARIDALLEGLKPRARHVLLCSRLEGKGHACIARELGVSLSTVEKDMALALRHCHDVLID